MWWYQIAFKAAKALYPIFRPMVEKRISDPAHAWDNAVLSALDKVFLDES